MNRFYLPSQNIRGDKIVINAASQLHHIRDVLRLSPKDLVTIFDDQGSEYRCLLEKISAQEAVFKIKDKAGIRSAQNFKVTVACAIPKRSRFEDIIDKLTQLGVEKIIPLETQRSVVRLGREKALARLERWKKIAIAASQQSQRSTLPEVTPVRGLRQVLSESAGYDLKIIPALPGKRKPLKEIFPEGKIFKDILVLIGPEGDFTPEEIAQACSAGFIPVSLGGLVLRVETAAVAVASFIMLYASH